MHMRACKPLLLESGHITRWKRWELPPHRNDGLEIVYVAAGRPRWRIGERMESVPAGSVFYSWPWELHGGVMKREPGVDLWFGVVALDRVYRRPPERIGFHRELVLPMELSRSIAGALLRRESRVVRDDGLLAELLPRMVHLAKAKPEDPQVRAILASLCRTAVLELARCSSQSNEELTEAEEAPHRVARFIDGLTQSCDEAWTLESMAAACGLKRTRFAELVSRLTGDSPIMALNRKRVARAEMMLRSGESVTATAMACGFSSSQYFARTYRSFTGRAPSETVV